MAKNKSLNFRKRYKFITFLGDCKENFSGLINTAFTETIGSLCRSFFWIICFFNVFVHWAKLFGLSSKTFRQSCNHCILRVHHNVLRKRIFRKNYKFFIFLGDCKESFGGVVNTAFTETIGFLCRSFFWVIGFFNVFLHWAKTFRPFVKNSSAKL